MKSKPDKKTTSLKFKVHGPNLSNGELSEWHYTTMEEAKTFAKNMAGFCSAPYHVLKLIGTFQQKRPKAKPVEWSEE